MGVARREHPVLGALMTSLAPTKTDGEALRGCARARELVPEEGERNQKQKTCAV
jgi:hypothetical protein